MIIKKLLAREGRRDEVMAKIVQLFVIILIILGLSSYILITLAQTDQSGTETITLTYKNFNELYEVCTYEDNWCGWAGYTGKAVIYGYMKKEIEVPEGADELEVTIQLCSKDWGEGLACNIDLWTPNSSAQIIVEEEVKEEKIPKLSPDDPHYHHHSYYKYEYGERFSHTFNVSGKDSVTLSIKMEDGARLDFWEAILTFRTIESVERYVGVCYGPFRDNEDPDLGILPTYEELQEDIKFISNLSKSLRTYGISKNMSEIPEFCQEAGVLCYPGAWISPYERENKKEIQSLIQVANRNLSCVKGLIVGNEVLFRGDASEEELIEYIREVKGNTTLPVGTAELWGTWFEHPQLAENVDFILVHIHPYWEGVHINEAANHTVKKWEELKAQYPEKEVIIGETGWPTQGDKIGEAVPSEENQRIFLSEILKLAEEEEIQYFYFDVFDEKWKEKFEGIVGAHWGLYYSNGTLKPTLGGLVPKGALKGISRAPREISVITTTVPLVVYTDADSPENHFYPSGWMGDLANLSVDYTHTDSPYSGENCIRIIYSVETHPMSTPTTPTPTLQPTPTQPVEGWAGIYWQYPINNWGDYPGYNISKATKLTFWARGKKGGEKAKFKIGGIASHGKPYRDSFDPVSTDPEIIELTNEWKKYTINNLSKQNLSMVLGGFCWVTNRIQNPEGCTIYLDEISFNGPTFGTEAPDDPYPSILGTHNGTIKLDNDVVVQRLYTYPCEGTGGHTEYVELYNTTFSISATWNGYQSDYHNITFPEPFILLANKSYNYTIITGSYPQIHHTSALLTTNGWINCTKFTDVNGKTYADWIPVIRLE